MTDSATIAAALLHDTVEDTATTLEEINDIFGKEVIFFNFFSSLKKNN